MAAAVDEAILLYNPNHDAHGRFAPTGTGSGMGRASRGPKSEKQKAATAKAARTRAANIRASNRDIMRKIEEQLNAHSADATAKAEGEQRKRTEAPIHTHRLHAAEHEAAAQRTTGRERDLHRSLAHLHRQAAEHASYLEHTKGSKSTEDRANRVTRREELKSVKAEIKSKAAQIREGDTGGRW